MSRRNASPDEDDGKVRLDKWLWAARFFKTRQLAHEAIELGRVLVDGERVKASRVAREGDALLVRVGPLEYRVTVLSLSTQRKGARDVGLLYSESDESRAAREEKAALLKAERASFPHGDGKPTKKGRRDIAAFRQKLRD